VIHLSTWVLSKEVKTIEKSTHKLQNDEKWPKFNSLQISFYVSKTVGNGFGNVLRHSEATNNYLAPPWNHFKKAIFWPKMWLQRAFSEEIEKNAWKHVFPCHFELYLVFEMWCYDFTTMFEVRGGVYLQKLGSGFWISSFVWRISSQTHFHGAQYGPQWRKCYIKLLDWAPKKSKTFFFFSLFQNRCLIIPNCVPGSLNEFGTLRECFLVILGC
jgi:hypothetical protein